MIAHQISESNQQRYIMLAQRLSNIGNDPHVCSDRFSTTHSSVALTGTHDQSKYTHSVSHHQRISQIVTLSIVTSNRDRSTGTLWLWLWFCFLFQWHSYRSPHRQATFIHWSLNSFHHHNNDLIECLLDIVGCQGARFDVRDPRSKRK